MNFILLIFDLKFQEVKSKLICTNRQSFDFVSHETIQKMSGVFWILLAFFSPNPKLPVSPSDYHKPVSLSWLLWRPAFIMATPPQRFVLLVEGAGGGVIRRDKEVDFSLSR